MPELFLNPLESFRVIFRFSEARLQKGSQAFPAQRKFRRNTAAMAKRIPI
jgi:hypothetical protein